MCRVQQGAQGSINYRVQDRFGKPKQLGTVIVKLLDKALCENSSPRLMCLVLHKSKQRTYYQYAWSSSNCFSKSLQDKTSRERQHPENQQLSISSQYAHEDISSLECCLPCLHLDCLRTSMSKCLENVSIAAEIVNRRFSLYLRSPCTACIGPSHSQYT